MMHIIRSHANQQQLEEMLQTFEVFVKLAVGVRRGILAGGGELHAECESLLLEDGSRQEDVWGADWNPLIHEVTYEALINIRPHQNNRSMEIMDPVIRERIRQIAQQLLGET